MLKRYFIISLCIVFSIGLLASCGTQTEEPVENEIDTSSTDFTSKEVSLRVWGAEEDEELLNAIIDSFKAEYGSQANFNITFEAHSESGVKDEILGDVLNAPDVFTFADDQLMAFVASGVLKKVENDTEISARNIESSSDAASLNGTLYAYPLTADNGYFLFYNKAYLTDEDVRTMDGLLAAAGAVGKKVYMEMNSGWYLYSFFGNTDMEIGLNDDGISTYCNWNTTTTNITGLQVAEAMLNIGLTPAFTATYDGGFPQGVADGALVAGVSGIWDENAIKDAWNEDYGACKLPTYTVAGEQLQMASYAGYKLVGVNSYSDNSSWAAIFADWMTNEENQTLRFEMRGQGPSNTNASSQGAVAESKAIQALQQQSEFSSLQRVGGSYWDPAATFGTLMSQGSIDGKSLQTLLNEMVSGITGEEVTEEVVDEITEEEAEESSEDVEEIEVNEETEAEENKEAEEESAETENITEIVEIVTEKQ